MIHKTSVQNINKITKPRFKNINKLRIIARRARYFSRLIISVLNLGLKMKKSDF